nr:unnamed protein product [Digitaria exilis]CAB3483594.1 unnamed protein product [Digitaria exilis]
MAPTMGKLRAIGAQIRQSLIAKRFLSQKKTKSGIWVPQGYESKPSLKDFLTEKWTKVKSLEEDLAGTKLKVQLHEEDLARVKGSIEETNVKLDTENNARKHGISANRRDLWKIAGSFKAMLLLNEAWMFKVKVKAIDPKVVSMVKVENFNEIEEVLKEQSEAADFRAIFANIKALSPLYNIQGNISIEEVDMLMRLLGKKLKKSFFEDMVNEGFVDESGRLQFSELVEILSLWNEKAFEEGPQEDTKANEVKQMTGDGQKQ